MLRPDQFGEDGEAEWDDGHRPMAADTKRVCSPEVAQANLAAGRHACADALIIGPFNSQETGSLSLNDDNDAINSNRTGNRSDGILFITETAVKKRKIVPYNRDYDQSLSQQASPQTADEENIQYNESLSALTSKSADQSSNWSDRNWQSSVDSQREVAQLNQSSASSQIQSVGNMHALSNISDMAESAESRKSAVGSDQEKEEEEYIEQTPAVPSTHVMRTRGQAKREMCAREQHDGHDDCIQNTTATLSKVPGESHVMDTLPRRRTRRAVPQSKRAHVELCPVSSETGTQHQKKGLVLQQQNSVQPAHVESDSIHGLGGQPNLLLVGDNVQRTVTEHSGPVLKSIEQTSAASGNNNGNVYSGDNDEIACRSRGDVVSASDERERSLKQSELRSDQMIIASREPEKTATSGRSSRTEGGSISNHALGTRTSENEQAAKQPMATNTFVTPCAKTLPGSHAASTGIVKNVGILASIEMKDHSKPSYEEANDAAHLGHSSIERHDDAPCAGTSRVTPTARHGQAEPQLSSDNVALAATQSSQMNKEARGDDEMSDVSTTVLVDEAKCPAHRESCAGAIIEAGVLDIAGFAELFGDIGNTKVQYCEQSKVVAGVARRHCKVQLRRREVRGYVLHVERVGNYLRRPPSRRVMTLRERYIAVNFFLMSFACCHAALAYLRFLQTTLHTRYIGCPVPS